MDGSGRGTNRLRLLVGAAPWSGLVHPVPEHAERSWRLTRAITGDEVLFAAVQPRELAAPFARRETKRGPMTTGRDDEFREYVLARRAGLVRTATLLTAGDAHLAEDLGHVLRR